MNGKVKIALLVTGLCCVALLGLGVAEYEQAIVTGAGERVWHHELAADRDVTVGTTSVPEDGIVDESFTSHLPLVIIDTMGEEIVNYKVRDEETSSYVYQEGVDPYTDIKISILDSADGENRADDLPTQSSYGRIKVRGNWSSDTMFPKLQYLLKLETEDGENNPLSVLGMDPSDTWILNGTMIDNTYLRNYLALNMAGELDPFTPDIRMCEVLLKRDNGYEYIGLYGMYEKIEQGEGRVDIEPVSNPIEISDRSYILQRDRREPNGYSMSVWSTQHQRSENWINLEYPSSENVTPEYWEYIQEEILEIEEVLYSDVAEEFVRYRSMLDVDSFVDYFILNEFFPNYDAGWNSTFLYKNEKGLVAIGPVWDFDAAMDNYNEGLLAIRLFVFYQAPWFDRLVRDEFFVNKVTRRYQELRGGLLSDENVQEKINQAAAFVEYPAKRDQSRWAAVDPFTLKVHEEEETGLAIAREQSTWEGEVQRLKDVLLLHGESMDNNLDAEMSSYVEYRPVISSLGGWLMITAFFVSIILVQRHRKGM